jgi:hypothetical protein
MKPEQRRNHSQTSEDKEAPLPPILTLFQRHKQKLLYGALLLAVGAVWSSRLLTKKESAREYEFGQAQVNLQQLLTTPEERGNAIAQLESVLQRHGELHAKYDGPLAQAHLNGGDPQAARAVAAPLLERHTSEYASFSEGSLLVAEGEFGAALQHAISLNEELKGVDAPLLRAHNLLRIALLQGEIGARQAERRAWEALLDELARGGAEPVFMQAFTSGALSLADYADARLKLLG